MKSIKALRKRMLGVSTIVVSPEHRPELFNFLGKEHKERAQTLAHRIIPDEAKDAEVLRNSRKEIFDYIVAFWERSLLSIPYMEEMGYGLNLAKRPFLTPVGPLEGKNFSFAEQYRWDTYFQNRGLILAGGHELAIDQLLNFADVFHDFKRVPNALTTVMLSHAQPPLEAISVFNLLDSGVKPGDWTQKVMRMVEYDLLTEWWDFDSGKMHKRQVLPTVEKYGLLTRYTRMHFHPLLSGCEDGKDHNWISATYGSNYLPVQLNAIIYGLLTCLIRYFEDTSLGNNPQRAAVYKEYQEELYKDFQKFFWHTGDKWEGFRNYSIYESGEGPILYGDLAAEIWPLFSGIATQEQAEITKNNLVKYYAGDYGLATTSLALRDGSTVPDEPQGGWSFQWEYPNCWPPLMYVAVEGLRKYGYDKEATSYAKRWVQYVEEEFGEFHGFAEKYPFSSKVPVSEGYYGNLQGFGWTIGVYLHFVNDLAKRGEL